MPISAGLKIDVQVNIMKHVSKVVRLTPDSLPQNIPDTDDLQATAKYMEDRGQFKEASRLYEKLLLKFPLKEYNYNRLMVIYRKQKDLEKEMKVIERGIKVFEEFYTPSPIGKDKKIILLSRKLNILSGLTDKKGKLLTDTEPLAKWKKRKELVLKKIKVSR